MATKLERMDREEKEAEEEKEWQEMIKQNIEWIQKKNKEEIERSSTIPAPPSDEIPDTERSTDVAGEKTDILNIKS